MKLISVNRASRPHVTTPLRGRLHELGRGPFLEGPGNLPGPISDSGDKCFLTEVKFC